MQILWDDILEPFEPLKNDPSPILWIAGVVAGVAAVTALVIVILVRKKKKGGK